MGFDRRFRGAFYATASVLFVTGTAWLAGDRLEQTSVLDAWRKTAAYLLMLHGGAAMLMLLLLGALIPLHVPVAWRRKKNRTSGAVMLASNAALIVTAFGLYYLGSETLRHWASDLHVGVGLGLPLLWAVHVWLGKRSVRAAPASGGDRPGRRRADRVLEPRRHTEPSRQG